MRIHLSKWGLPPNDSNIDTPTPILDKYPESDAHIIRKSFLQNASKCFGFLQMDASWLDGRLMVQEAVQMPHTELHGMDEAKARKSGNKSDEAKAHR